MNMKDLRFDQTVLTKGGLKLCAVVYFDENGKPTTEKTMRRVISTNVDRVT